MKKRLRALARRALAVAGVAALAAGCTDLSGPTGGTVIEPLQLEVVVQDEASRAVLARVLPTGEVQGSLTINGGGQRNLVVLVLDQNGQGVVVGPADRLRVFTTNTVVAAFQQSGYTKTAAYGTLVGNSTGSTSMQVQFIEGTSTSFTSPSIPVTVR